MKLKNNSLQNVREKYIRAMAEAENTDGITQKAISMADDLFAIDLTMYSSSFSFDSVIYNSFASSYLDENISLHPEQLQIINHIEEHEASIISAPTSFGKTFCIFEYIARYKPQNIVLIVPTLALVEEYFKKIIRKFKPHFGAYKIYTSIDETKDYNFNQYNIFILTHDRIVQTYAYSKIKRIDFLVIDEVYKLETEFANDRVLVLNMAYYHLAKIAKKYTLLAPFISDVLDCEHLEKSPVFYKTSYSPVVNDVIVRKVLSDKDKNKECERILRNEINEEDKTLIYFPSVSQLYKFIQSSISTDDNKIIDLPQDVFNFILWAKEEIHDEWCVIKALKYGYLIHNGQIPIGVRMFQLDSYEKSKVFNRMLCTSTLLEGVNTSAKYIIITNPSRSSDRDNSFSAFDFYNLVGRTGRLCEHLIGTAYYLKSPNDPIYLKDDAIKSIRFELSDSSKDIDIQIGDIDSYDDVVEFLHNLDISIEEYRHNIGTTVRFATAVELHDRYKGYKDKLINILSAIFKDSRYGRPNLIKVLYDICEGNINPRIANLNKSLIINLLYKTRPTIKSVVTKIVDGFESYNKNNNKKIEVDLDYIISSAIKIKSSYIEHRFYGRICLIKYYMEIDQVPSHLISILEHEIINTIDYLYFANSKPKKMLVDLGIYERDIEAVIKIIGDDFDDANELKERLNINRKKFKKLSYISQFIISNLLS